jgi:hypothetical protein
MSWRAVYIGPDSKLSGETAMVYRTFLPLTVAAQFNTLHLASRGRLLSHGWHYFQQSDFNFNETKTLKRKKRPSDK